MNEDNPLVQEINEGTFVPQVWMNAIVDSIVESNRRWDRLMGIPEPTEYEKSLWREEHRAKDAARHRELAADADALDIVALEHPALAAVIELHRPVDCYAGEWPVCDGCDMDGYEAERPGWPCRTIDAILGRTE